MSAVNPMVITEVKVIISFLLMYSLYRNKIIPTIIGNPIHPPLAPDNALVHMLSITAMNPNSTSLYSFFVAK